MFNKLYIVSTYYHALISCIKQLNYKADADIVVTDYISDGKALSEKIRKSDLFDHVYYIDNINEYEASGKIDYIFNHHRKNAALIKQQLPISFEDYKEIYIFHDNIWAAHYCKDTQLGYNLIEDALDSFKNISSSNFFFMLPRSRLKALIKRTFRIGYVFCGYDNCTKTVEVNDKNDLEISDFASKKIIQAPRRDMFEKLNNSDIDILKEIFSKDMPVIDEEKTVLILTQPLFPDGIVESESDQKQIYKNMINEYTDTSDNIVIKPHPRDTVDYSSLYPNAIILEKDMPVEILKYSFRKPFKKIITYDSTSFASLNAKAYIRTRK